MHHIGENTILERVAETAVKGIDCVGDFHMVTVKKNNKASFW